MGDTIDHIRKHLESLRQFSAGTWWYKGNTEKMEILVRNLNFYETHNCHPNMCATENLTFLGWVQREQKEYALYAFAEELLQAFEQGTIFQFLNS